MLCVRRVALYLAARTDRDRPRRRRARGAACGRPPRNASHSPPAGWARVLHSGGTLGFINSTRSSTMRLDLHVAQAMTNPVYLHYRDTACMHLNRSYELVLSYCNTLVPSIHLHRDRAPLSVLMMHTYSCTCMHSMRCCAVPRVHMHIMPTHRIIAFIITPI